MPTIGPNLDWHKGEAIKQINKSIGETRLTFITDLPGQEAIYQEKRDEASRYISEGRPSDLADYPMLGAEAGITAATASDLADMWIGLNQQWVLIAADLEKIRMAAVKAIGAASIVSDVEAALNTFRAALAAYTPPGA